MMFESPNISISTSSKERDTSTTGLTKEFIEKFNYQVINDNLLNQMEYFIEEVRERYNVIVPIDLFELQEGRIVITNNVIISELIKRMENNNENSNR